MNLLSESSKHQLIQLFNALIFKCWRIVLATYKSEAKLVSCSLRLEIDENCFEQLICLGGPNVIAYHKKNMTLALSYISL